jgi:hypothetical protein
MIEKQIIGNIVVEIRHNITLKKETPASANTDNVLRLGRGSDTSQMVANGEPSFPVEAISASHPKSMMNGTAKDLVIIHTQDKIPSLSVVALKNGMWKSVAVQAQTRSDIGQTIIEDYAKLVDFQPSILRIVLI